MPRHRSARDLVLVVGLLGALTACQHSAPRATPTSPSSTATSSASTATPSAPSSTRSSSATTSSATRTAAPPTISTALVLGPDGLGPLKLGMSRSEAEATGMVEPFRNEPMSERCSWRSRLTGAPVGEGTLDEGTVLHSDTLGVATIETYAGLRTPEGIGIGSSLAAVDQAYPRWRDNVLGRGIAPVPGHDALVYRIGYDGGYVTRLTLQYANQDCYE